MSVEVVPGGQRRIDRVLDRPSWCAARPVATRTSAGCWQGCRAAPGDDAPGTFSAVPSDLLDTLEGLKSG